MFSLSFVFNISLKLYIRSNFLKRAITYADNNKCPHNVTYLYVREVRSVKFRVKHTHRMFENRVLGNILGSKRQEVTGQWRRLHKRELTISTLYQILLGSSSKRE